jgi:Ca2+-binding EF-hand superfamily protein
VAESGQRPRGRGHANSDVPDRPGLVLPRVPADRDQSTLVGAGLAALLLAGPSTAQTPDAELRERFRAADRNGDGKIDREEFHQRSVEQFYFRDAARRGHLTREQVQGTSDEAYKAADRDGDGRLSLEEFLNARHKDFEAADTNRDGTLSLEEIAAYRNVRR